MIDGVAALRQEAYRADRHFSNASNKIFEAIITQLPAIHKQNGSTETGSIFEYSLFQKRNAAKNISRNPHSRLTFSHQ